MIYRNSFKTLWYSENHEILVFIVLPFIQKAYILRELLGLVLPLSCHRKEGCGKPDAVEVLHAIHWLIMMDKIKFLCHEYDLPKTHYKCRIRTKGIL